MSTAWTPTRLGDVLRIKHGFAFSGMAENRDTSLPVVVGIGNFDYAGGFRFGSTTLKRYTGEYPPDFNLAPGHVLLAMTCQTAGGEILGIPGVVPDDGQTYLHNQRLGKVEVRDPERIDLPFIFQLARWQPFNHHLFATASGSKILHTSPGRIEEFVVRLPPLMEQRAIAATLGALDDKIESNQRAIDTLKHLSSAVFSDWRRQTAVSEVSTFGDYADVYGGATPKTSIPEYWGGDLAWATPTDVTGLASPYLFETSRTITEDGLRSCTAQMHPAGTIFMTSRATIGAFAINQVPAASNQGFIAVRPKRESDIYFLFEEMRSRVDEFLANANGSTFLEISRGRFKSLPLELPEPRLLDSLNVQLMPLHAKATQLSRESRELVGLRDALLPELLSGRLRVHSEGVAA